MTFWFGGQNRNRRFERKQEYQLNLKAGKLPVRAFSAALIFTLVFFMGLFLLWRGGEWLAAELLYNNETFAITNISIETDGILQLDQIRRWSGVKMGENLLSLDLALVKRDLELVPFIESAAVERELPNQIRLRITEREPIARIYTFQGQGSSGQVEPVIYYIDQAGFVIPPLSRRLFNTLSNSSLATLPTLTGLQPSDLRAGRAVESASIYNALHLLAEFQKSNLVGLTDIKNIDVADPQAIIVTTAQGTDITLAPADFETQLRRWRVVFDYGVKAEKSIASLDLAVTNYVPVRWMDEAPPLPVGPRVKPHSLYRKKHV